MILTRHHTATPALSSAPEPPEPLHDRTAHRD